MRCPPLHRTFAVACLAAAGAAQDVLAPPPVVAPAEARTDGAAAYADLLQEVEAWQRAHPRLVQRVDIGTSVQGRPLFVLRIGTPDDGSPEVYLGAGIHGRERTDLDLRYMVGELLAKQDEPEVRELLRTRVLWVQPMVNPDGLVALGRTNAHGVDLNRNFGVRWQPRTRKDPERHPGPSAFSEPETCAVRDFLRSRPRLRAYLDLHRSVRMLIPAQSGDDGKVEDAVEDAARTLDAAAGDHSQANARLPHFPSMHGLSIDWVWGELGVFAFTMENRDAAPITAAGDGRWLALRHLLERAGEYPERRQPDGPTDK